MIGSVSRMGAAGDNAAMESSWPLLQTKELNRRQRTTRPELRLAIMLWIERKHYRQRPQASLGGLTPIENEDRIATGAAAAASTTSVTRGCITPDERCGGLQSGHVQ